MTTRTGLECLLRDPSAISGRRVAVLANYASVDRSFRYAWDLIAALPNTKLVSIWSPQHGLFGQQQANMVETSHSRHPELQIPVYSLYGHTREPTSEMLDGFDLLLIDLQDVGTRVYTFAWTIRACLQAAAKSGIEVWILDRPNPIGGTLIEGPMLDDQYKSFVGMESIPMRHALTLGELAIYSKNQSSIDVELSVIKMSSWARNQSFGETGLPWLPPSPNVPMWQTALVYPGQVLLEGTNISEGRGTTRPFECAGAPFIDGLQLADCLNNDFELKGIRFRPIQFLPTFDKYAGKECGGVFCHITDSHHFRSLQCTVGMLAAIEKIWPGELTWTSPPYEYETIKMPIDILWGSDLLRKFLGNSKTVDTDSIEQICGADQAIWWSAVGEAKLYE